MDQAQHFLTQPGVGFLMMIVIGAIAGWIAERMTDSRHGLLTNILVGVAGALVGGTLADLANIAVFGFWRTLIAATVGAIILIVIWRAVRGQRS